ncbi:glycosyltransferase family 1 protein [Salinifilum aidingensis]
MRIVVDARWTRTDTPDGISRYGANLIAALHRLHPVTMLVCDERQLRLLPQHVPHVRVHSPLSPRELWLSRTLHRLGADVVFSPMQVIGGFRRRYRLVLTLHDLIYYRHPSPPSFLPLPVRAVWRLFHLAYWPQRVLLDRADMVVTVSDTTRRLIEQHRLTRRPVRVVHNAPSSELAAEAGGDPPAAPEGGEPAGCAKSGGPAEAGEDDEPAEPVESAEDGTERGEDGAGSTGAGAAAPRELVYMGSFMPYKNVETLLAGMAHLPGHRLHLLGRLPPRREAQLRRVLPPGADVVFRGGIGDADYRRLLLRAAALVTASKDEGFGLPLIEAMQLGTPVVCSDLAIFGEVTGGNAVFFDPADPADFARAVRAAAEEPLRSALRAGGRAQADRFTWEEAARRLLDGMRELHGAPQRTS